jgi:hypothetical protein
LLLSAVILHKPLLLFGSHFLLVVLQRKFAHGPAKQLVSKMKHIIKTIGIESALKRERTGRVPLLAALGANFIGKALEQLNVHEHQISVTTNNPTMASDRAGQKA